MIQEERDRELKSFGQDRAPPRPNDFSSVLRSSRIIWTEMSGTGKNQSQRGGKGRV